VSEKKTERGFRVFGEIPFRNRFAGRRSPVVLRVQESSLAFEGAHCWLFFDNGPDMELPGEMLDVAGAKSVIEALQAFISAAEGGELIEPAKKDPRRVCQSCDGTGNDNPANDTDAPIECPECNGTGWTE